MRQPSHRDPAPMAMTSRGAITGITLIAGFSSTVGWPISALFEHAVGWRGACASWAALHLLVGPASQCVGVAQPPGRRRLAGGRGGALRPARRTTATGVRSAGYRSAGYRWAGEITEIGGMFLLAFIFATSGMVTIGMATNLPLLFTAMGVPPAVAIATRVPAGSGSGCCSNSGIQCPSPHHAACERTSGECAAPARRGLTIAIGGAPAIVAFSVLHGAGQRHADHLPRHLAARALRTRRLWAADGPDLRARAHRSGVGAVSLRLSRSTIWRITRSSSRADFHWLRSPRLSRLTLPAGAVLRTS